MLGFVNKGKACKQYCFPSRVEDCEKSITFFNYLTPMAICVEIIVKDASICAEYYADEEESDKDTRTSLISLIDNQAIRNELYEWGINDFLIERVKEKIYKPNNDYKHHLVLNMPNPGPDARRDTFRIFYKFLSHYYEHKTGLKAPRWDDNECAKLFEKREQDFNARTSVFPQRRT